MKVGIAGLSKVSSLNPFPPPIQKLSHQPQGGGGGFGASFQPSPFQTRIEVKTEPQKQDNLNQQQLILFQNDTKRQLNAIQDTQKYNTRGIYAAGMALTNVANGIDYINNQSYPPPTNLNKLNLSTYHREYEVDSTDGEGVVARNDPMVNFRAQDISFEDNPMIQQSELAPTEEEQPTQEDQPTDYGTDAGFYDVAEEPLPIQTPEGKRLNHHERIIT